MAKMLFPDLPARLILWHAQTVLVAVRAAARKQWLRLLTTRLTFGGTGTSGNTELLVFCIGQQVWENQFDDDSSFMPTSVSVEEVV